MTLFEDVMQYYIYCNNLQLFTVFIYGGEGSSLAHTMKVCGRVEV